MKILELTKREIGIIGLTIFLIYGQSDDKDFDSVIGRTTDERNAAILSLKAEVSGNAKSESSGVRCEINEDESEILKRILLQIFKGHNINEAGFNVRVDEIERLISKFS